jgi:hypothetical protein
VVDRRLPGDAGDQEASARADHVDGRLRGRFVRFP